MSGQKRIEMVRIGDEWAVRAYYDPILLPKLRALPGARWDRSYRVWFIDSSDKFLLDLIAGLNDIGCPVPRELLDRARSVARAVDSADQRALERASDARLYPFQKDGVRWLARRVAEGRNALLADEMGLGKTVQALMALPDGAPVVVVCPACIKGVWRAEAAKWRPEFSLSVLRGQGSFRWPAPGEIVVINYDILPDYAGDPLRGTVLIGDEIHMTKGRKTRRTLRFRMLADAVRSLGGWVWGLTGTPLLNRPPELFQILDNLGLVDESFRTFRRFYRDFNASPSPSGFGTEWGMPEPDVPVKLGRVQLRREREAVLEELPGKTWTSLVVNGMPESVRKLCDEALEEWEAYAGEVSSARGLPPFEMMSHVRDVLARYKIPFMLDLVEQFEEAGEPLVVFSAHRTPVEELGKRDGWEVIVGGTPPERRTEIVRDFQAGKLRGIAATIKAGGVGLTLTRAHQMIFVDLEWTPALNSQAEDRIARIGQKNACQYITIVADHPLDARLTELLQEKRGLIDATIKHGDGSVKNGGEIVEAARVAEEVAEAVDDDSVRCPNCGRRVEVRVAGQHSRHPGWKYIKCFCGEFQWVDGDVPDEEKAALKADLYRLLTVCDGAVTRDAQGFNKTDAWKARAMARSLKDGFEIDWFALKEMLHKYRGTQLVKEVM